MVETLVTVPPRMAAYLNSPAGAALRQRLAWDGAGQVYVSADPPGQQLGSGGGTVHLLWRAWQASGVADLDTWLRQRQKLVLHAGGLSRRLPAYAAVGKCFIPLPYLPGLDAQRHDQLLCDLQVPRYCQVLAEAGTQAVAMVTSGDVWLEFNPLDLLPMRGDICGIGMRVRPEVAQHFGVFFVRKGGRLRGPAERPVSFFLQKPGPAEISRHLHDYDFYVDTGMWLLSARGVRLLFATCGWDTTAQAFSGPQNLPGYLDLYADLGPALGRVNDPVAAAFRPHGLADLQATVVPLDEARFHHLGSSRQLFDCLEQVQRQLPARRHFVIASPAARPRPQGNHPVWLEGSASDTPLTLAGYNLVTGLPAGAPLARLAENQCVDAIPVGPANWCLRIYHLDDPLRGTARQGAVLCGQPATQWLTTRGLDGEFDRDVYDVPMYVVLPATALDQGWVEWYFAVTPDPARTAAFRMLPKLAARDLQTQVDYGRYYAQRDAAYRQAVREFFGARLVRAQEAGEFAQDFTALAAAVAADPALAAQLREHGAEVVAEVVRPEHRARVCMFLDLLSTDGHGAPAAGAVTWREQAFGGLRAALIGSIGLPTATPLCALKADQIVWSRSPVRLDLAGGWTDTPPYCLEFGGSVLNVAVMLNGQPPIQTIVRMLDEPVLRLRSIDLGSVETISSYAQLAAWNDPAAAFSLPKAALALAGFHPDFCVGQSFSDLPEHLAAFGGGLEVSTLCAVPKGSGLGTSSILAATILAALSRACNLGWLELDVYHRVLAVEQLLTTGGGWQDQAGALWRGLKLIQTAPGPDQEPVVRFLPEHLLAIPQANTRYLLYYTGITRMAKHILQEIVRHMFLGRRDTLSILDLIRRNSLHAYQAILTGDDLAFARAIHRAWQLNCRLDPDTTTPEIATLLATCGDDLAAAKLLGAGGGGYLFICARDPAAGARIRARFDANPPNPRARFVDFEVASTGTQVTVS